MIDLISYKSSKYLAQEDCYKSVGIKHYSSLLATIRFFSVFPRIVVSGGKLAKKGLYNSKAWVDASLDILYLLENSGIEINVEGMKNISSIDGPVVFISNHMSTLETVILPSIIQPAKEVTFIVKQELLRIPYFGRLLKARQPIVVGRTNPREDLTIVMETGSEYLSKGKSIIIFPQKTRSNRLEVFSFNSLGIKLAKRANVPVIPLALITDAWGNGKIIKEFGKMDPTKKVHFSFGKPFKVSSSGTKEHLQVLDFIKSKLNEWGRGTLIKE